MKVFIISHDDLDGIGAASVAYEYFSRYEQDVVEEIIINNIDYTIDLKNLLYRYTIEKYDYILFLDYSFSNNKNLEYLINLIKNEKHILWIDHHKTSLDILSNKLQKYDHYYENFTHVIDVKYCATYLTYKWFMNIIHGDEYEYNIPEFIQYINSHDLWLHNKPETEEFVYGISKYTISSIDFIRWHIASPNVDIFKADDALLAYDRSAIRHAIEDGRIIKEYLNDMYKKQVKSKSFEIEINDETTGLQYKGLALNGIGNSLVFGDKINYYDFVCLFQFHGTWTYSLYSSNDVVDCGDLAYKLGTIDNLGGGGHKGAAGFVTDRCIFNLSRKIIIKNFDNNINVILVK